MKKSMHTNTQCEDNHLLQIRHFSISLLQVKQKKNDFTNYKIHLQKKVSFSDEMGPMESRQCSPNFSEYFLPIPDVDCRCFCNRLGVLHQLL